jgi:hypothetical protein
MTRYLLWLAGCAVSYTLAIAWLWVASSLGAAMWVMITGLIILGFVIGTAWPWGPPWSWRRR